MFGIPCWIFAWSRPLDLGDFLGYIEAERFHSNHKTVRKVLSHHGLRFSRDLAGYAASGLTQPTVTIQVTDAGIKLGKASPAYGDNLPKKK